MTSASARLLSSVVAFRSEERQLTAAMERCLESGLCYKWFEAYDDSAGRWEETPESVICKLAVDTYEHGGRAKGSLILARELYEIIPEIWKPKCLTLLKALKKIGKDTIALDKHINLTRSAYLRVYALQRMAPIFDPGGNGRFPDDFINVTHDLTEEIRAAKGKQGEALADGAELARKRSSMLASTQQTTALLTGWRDFDGYSRGFRAGELVVIAAGAKIGKSMYDIATLANIVQCGGKVLRASLEMSVEDEIARMECYLLNREPEFANVENLLNYLIFGGFTDSQLAKRDLVLERFWSNGGNIKMLPPSECTMDNIERYTQEIAESTGLDFISIDTGNHLYWRGSSVNREFGNESYAQGKVAARLIELGDRYKLPVMVNVQTKPGLAAHEFVSDDCISESSMWLKKGAFLKRLYVSGSIMQVQLIRARRVEGQWRYALRFDPSCVRLENPLEGSMSSGFYELPAPDFGANYSPQNFNQRRRPKVMS